MELKARQAASARVRDKVISALLQFTPAWELKLGDVRYIADMAAAAAFDEFSEERTP
jgi:hypothetical protein